MAKLSQPRYAAGATESFSERACELCGSDELVTVFALSRDGRKPRERLAICIRCILYAAERRTGFGWVNQHDNWSAASKRLRVNNPRRKR